MKSCQYCGKNFSRGYNLQRHLENSCPLSPNSEEKNMTEYPEHDYDHREIEEDEMEEESQSDEEMFDADADADEDDDMSDTDSEHEESVWSAIIEEAKNNHRQEYEELVQELLDDGVNEEEAKDKAYHQILPVLQKEARNIYLEKLKWMKSMRRDPVHKKVMETKQSYMDDDGFDGEEALEAAVNKRKFLLNKIFDEDEGYHEEDNDEDSY